MAEDMKPDSGKPTSLASKDQTLGLGDPGALANPGMGAAAAAVAAKAAGSVQSGVSSPTTPPAPANSEPATASAPSPKIVYEASGIRKTLLSLVFLLLLPFFVSLPAMLYQRLTHQLWTDTLGVAIFAGAFALVMLLVVYELVHSIRSRVEISDTALKFTLPAARGIGMPKLRYRSQEIPFSQIDAVEMRREIYGGSLAPVLLRGARVITKDGEKVPLGYISEANVDPTLPLPEIAQEVARRVGIEVTDRGNVRREFRKKLRGIQTLAELDEGISPAEVETLNRRHHNLILTLCCALFVLIAAGILIDISKSSLQLGERAAVAQSQKK